MSEQPTSCVQRHITVHRNQLPVSCPLPDQALWNTHPRVYLPLEDQDQVICPYCSTTYHLA